MLNRTLSIEIEFSLNLCELCQIEKKLFALYELRPGEILIQLSVYTFGFGIKSFSIGRDDYRVGYHDIDEQREDW